MAVFLNPQSPYWVDIIILSILQAIYFCIVYFTSKFKLHDIKHVI